MHHFPSLASSSIFLFWNHTSNSYFLSSSLKAWRKLCDKTKTETTKDEELQAPSALSVLLCVPPVSLLSFLSCLLQKLFKSLHSWRPLPAFLSQTTTLGKSGWSSMKFTPPANPSYWPVSPHKEDFAGLKWIPHKSLPASSHCNTRDWTRASHARPSPGSWILGINYVKPRYIK